MEKTEKHIIRKLIIGQDPKNSFAFELGKVYATPTGELKIVEIEEDETSFYFFGNIRFNVWVEYKKNETALWKSFEKMPVIIEYQL